MAMRLLIGISLSSLHVFSSFAADTCSWGEPKSSREVKIQGVPGYFFKIHPSGKYVSYIGMGNNILLDFMTGEEFELPGDIDPTWSPDGVLFARPKYKSGIQLTWGEPIIAKAREGKLNEISEFTSPLSGVYQSIGKVGDHYRMVSDHKGATVGDFSYTQQDGFKLIAPFESPCKNMPNIGKDLPMLSKDGKFLSLYDSGSKSTKIYSLAESNCELALDLGFPTGKVSFNQESSQISFHVDQFTEFDSGYFSGIGHDKVKNVVVMNLDKSDDGKKLFPTSWALASSITKLGNGGYYPDFDLAGNVYYMQDTGNDFQFVMVKGTDLEFRPFESDLFPESKDCTNCKTPKPKKSFFTVLADLWSSTCKASQPLPPTLVMGLDPVACQELVAKFYVDGLDASREDLLKTCPQKTKSHSTIVVGEWNPQQRLNAEALINSKCIACHTEPREYEKEVTLYVTTGPSEKDQAQEKVKVSRKMPAIDLDHLTPRLISSMAQSIAAGEMPKGFSLTKEERNLLIEYLSKKTLKMEEDSHNSFQYITRYSEANLQQKLEEELKRTGTSEYLVDWTTKMVNCVYGQKNCSAYFELLKPGFLHEAEKLPEADRASFLENKMMQQKCQVLVDVTLTQCEEWAESSTK